jgi:hypothetical protein
MALTTSITMTTHSMTETKIQANLVISPVRAKRAVRSMHAWL